MKKRILTVLLAVCLVFALGTVTAMADALPAAGADGVIRLTSSLTVNTIPLNTTGETIVDLNGYELTITGAVNPTSGQTLTFMDSSVSGTTRGGTLVLNGVTGASAAISPSAGATVNVSNITVTCTGSAFYPHGDAAAVNITNSDVTAAVYCVATNAAIKENYGVVITLTGSTFTANASGGDNCPVMINVPGSLIMDNCTVTGDRMGVLVRAGKAEITNCTITATGEFTESSSQHYENKNWGSGNEVPMAAIVVGSRNGAYNGDTDCNITNTVINAPEDDSKPAVYVSSNSNGSYSTDLTVSGGAVTGKVVVADGAESTPAAVTFDGGAEINGNINLNSMVSSVAVINATHDGEVTVAQGSAGTVYVASAADNKYVALNSRTMKAYESLEGAIEEAAAGDTITLVDSVSTTATVRVDKELTIVGNGYYSIVISHDENSETRQKALIIDAPLTLDKVNLTINGYTESGGHVGDGIQIGENTSDYATLTIRNSSNVSLQGVNNAMVMPGGAGAKVTVSNSSFNLYNIGGNGSNGGTYVFENADVNVNGCASYGFSVYSMTTRGNTTIAISGTGYSAIYGHSTLDFGGNTIVNVDNCGPTVVGGGNQWGYRDAPIQLRRGPEGAKSITIGENAVINITNCTDNAGNPINNIYVVAGTTYTNEGTVNANVVMAEAPEGQYSVARVNNGVTLDSRYVDPNYSYSLPNLADRGGSTFAGWRVNGGSVVPGGTVYTITRNTVFTAVWDLIEIPDTYEINVSAGANGEVDVSLNNASAGSVITITATPDEGYRVGAVTVSGPDGRVEVTRVNATTYTFVMPAGGVEIDVSFVEDAALSEPFTDVSEGHWFYEYVAYVYTHGLMEGTSATTFEPDAGMTRAMFWAVLARIDGQSVSGANWLETARAWAMAEGVSDGTAASELVTREQMVTMLYRFAGSPVAGGMALSEFADAGSVSSWASDAMSWALGEGVISGMGGGMLSPQGTATRAQAAAILMRFVEG